MINETNFGDLSIQIKTCIYIGAQRETMLFGRHTTMSHLLVSITGVMIIG